MNTRMLRFTKEARPLLWPWIVVSSLGVMPLLFGEFWHRIPVAALTLLGAAVGIPLLATLPFGTEFQHHTFPALLSQPLDRTRVWGEKVKVALMAAACAAAVHYTSWHIVARDDRTLRLTGPLLIVFTFCSATYWTLVGKSTIGGLMLNLLTAGTGIGAILYGAAIGWPKVPDADVELAISILCLSLAAFMFWLGQRKFARFEYTGTGAGTDMMAGVLFAALRPQRESPRGNLLRKELRLLAPVWLLSAITIVLLVCLAALHSLMPAAGGLLATTLSSLGAALTGIALTVAPLLAGTLSVGEEREAGTQIWNLVLPTSIRRQWMLKFTSGLLTCFASQALVLFTASATGNRTLTEVLPQLAASNRLGVAVLTILIFVSAFWCACAVGGTVRAALLTFPALVIVGAASVVGYWLGLNRVQFHVYSLLLAWFHPYPYSVARSTFESIAGLLPAVLVLPLIAFAVVQGYRFFRTDETRHDCVFISRRLLPLLMMAVLTGFSMVVSRFFLYSPHSVESQVMVEVHDAVVQRYSRELDAAGPVRLTPKDVAQLPALSAVTRAWVRNATTIALFPTEPAAAQFGRRVSPYYVQVSYPNGRECRSAGPLSFCVEPQGSASRLSGTGPFASALLVRANVAETMVISRVSPVVPQNNGGRRPVTVSLKVFVDEKGYVTWARPLSGEEPYTSAAVKAVEQWRYEPLQVLGWPADMITTVTLNFP